MIEERHLTPEQRKELGKAVDLNSASLPPIKPALQHIQAQISNRESKANLRATERSRRDKRGE